MSRPLTIECDVYFYRRGRGSRKELQEGPEPQPAGPPGRVPRVARLMALALHFEQMVRDGVVADYAALARLGQVTRARISQIMNLLLLAPDLQEAVLFLPRTDHQRDPIQLRHLLPIAAALDWRQQRRLWKKLGDAG